MNTTHNPYEFGLDRTDANFVQLSPLTFMERSASVYPNKLAVIHGEIKRTWAETYARCRRLASALKQRGIGVGDTVAVMAPNIPMIFEAHFGVPMLGAVLNTLNTRLDAEAIAFMLEHGEAKVVFVDGEFADVVRRALRLMQHRPIVVDINDPYGPQGLEYQIGETDYEAFLETGDPGFEWSLPDDEWQAITLNYTSGTTGNPKGVVYHHRGAYLNAVSNTVTWEMPLHATYLWTLPMFHCNGWCFPWTIAVVAGTNVCLRAVRADHIFDLIKANHVTHMCGAPIVHNLLINAPDEMKQGLNHVVRSLIAGAAPPAAIIAGMEKMGFKLTHVYGLTESYGPAVVCAWHEEWDALSLDEQSELKSRQGVRYPMLEGLMVADPKDLSPVPKDGKSMGEIFMRGNNIMKGYLKNPRATEESFEGGWFHTGDLAVWHPDGYVQIKDRSKDIIISGGENISTVEVEDVLYRHPAILEAAVVARPDEKWGETPCAFITLKPSAEGNVTGDDIIQFCRTQMAHFKAPKTVVFCSLPKTSTGKIQKFVLREQARDLNGK